MHNIIHWYNNNIYNIRCLLRAAKMFLFKEMSNLCQERSTRRSVVMEVEVMEVEVPEEVMVMEVVQEVDIMDNISSSPDNW